MVSLVRLTAVAILLLALQSNKAETECDCQWMTWGSWSFCEGDTCGGTKTRHRWSCCRSREADDNCTSVCDRSPNGNPTPQTAQCDFNCSFGYKSGDRCVCLPGGFGKCCEYMSTTRRRTSTTTASYVYRDSHETGISTSEVTSLALVFIAVLFCIVHYSYKASLTSSIRGTNIFFNTSPEPAVYMTDGSTDTDRCYRPSTFLAPPEYNQIYGTPQQTIAVSDCNQDTSTEHRPSTVSAPPLYEQLYGVCQQTTGASENRDTFAQPIPVYAPPPYDHVCGISHETTDNSAETGRDVETPTYSVPPQNPRSHGIAHQTTEFLAVASNGETLVNPSGQILQ